jgi:hypothetical protein
MFSLQRPRPTIHVLYDVNYSSCHVPRIINIKHLNFQCVVMLQAEHNNARLVSVNGEIVIFTFVKYLPCGKFLCSACIVTRPAIHVLYDVDYSSCHVTRIINMKYSEKNSGAYPYIGLA